MPAKLNIKIIKVLEINIFNSNSLLMEDIKS